MHHCQPPLRPIVAVSFLAGALSVAGGLSGCEMADDPRQERWSEAELERIRHVCDLLSAVEPDEFHDVIRDLAPIDHVLFAGAFQAEGASMEEVGHDFFTHMVHSRPLPSGEALTEELIARDRLSALGAKGVREMEDIDSGLEKRDAAEQLLYGAMRVMEGYVHDGAFSRKACLSVARSLSTTTMFLHLDGARADDVMVRCGRMIQQLDKDAMISHELAALVNALHQGDQSLLAPLLEHDDVTIRHEAALTMTTYGVKEGAPALLTIALELGDGQLESPVLAPVDQDGIMRRVRKYVRGMPEDVDPQQALEWYERHREKLRWTGVVFVLDEDRPEE